MDYLLKIVEANEDKTATTGNLQMVTGMWLAPAKLQLLAVELWGFLNLNVTGQARPVFENVGDLQGFEAWRKLTKGVRSRAEVRKLSFLSNVKIQTLLRPRS